MPELDDITLLRQYAEGHSESAFAALVERYVNLVYSTALRGAGNAPAAEEITQAVFIILARKAGSLGAKTVLSGWLYQAARLTAGNFLRGEIRRQHREQEACMQSLLNESATDDAWRQIAPLLDDAMRRLGEKDRNAVVLRFLENKSLAEVGAALGASEDAAKMRVNRALEKLRNFFSRRGISSTTAIIAGAVTANSVHAAPVGLGKAISAVAVAKGATASTSTLTLIKGALKIMAWTKAKTAIVVGVGVLFAAGTTTITVKEIQEHRTYPWQTHEGMIYDAQLNQPPQVRILPSRFRMAAYAMVNGKMIGTGVSAKTMVASAYGFGTPARTIVSAELPANRFDYIACLQGGEDANEHALQAEVKRKFGVVGRVETRETDVWLLKVKSANAPGLKPVKQPANTFNMWDDSRSRYEIRNEPLSELTASIEYLADVPVINRTGLAGNFSLDLDCAETDLQNRNWDKVNEALDQLGLELVPSRESIETLVVEKAK